MVLRYCIPEWTCRILVKRLPNLIFVGRWLKIFVNEIMYLINYIQKYHFQGRDKKFLQLSNVGSVLLYNLGTATDVPKSTTTEKNGQKEYL